VLLFHHLEQALPAIADSVFSAAGNALRNAVPFVPDLADRGDDDRVFGLGGGKAAEGGEQL
jgi:hypothetical protein